MKTKGTIVVNKKGQLVAGYRFVPEYVRWGMDCSDDYEAISCHYSANALEKPELGKTYMVATNEYVGPNPMRKNDCRLSFKPDNGEGWPGNSSPAVKRYHGWRGTNDDWSLHGRGVRKCLSVTTTGQRSKHVRIVFGADLKKDKE